MRRRLPSTQALACFDAAARHGSFTRAAQELALTQGAVSRQVALLESFLGLPLFKRTQRGMALTPAGVDYARQVRLRLDGLERDTLDLIDRQGEGAALTLGAVPTFATRWLIPRLPLLAQSHPGLLFAGTQEQVAQWVGSRAVLLLPEDVLPVCSPALLPRGKPVTPQALASMPLLQSSTRQEAWREWFEAQDIDAPAAMQGPRYEQFSMQAAAAACGLGVALVPTLLVEAELAQGLLVPACNRPQRGQRSYYLVYPDLTESPALKTLKQWLLSQVPSPSAGRNGLARQRA